MMEGTSVYSRGWDMLDKSALYNPSPGSLQQCFFYGIIMQEGHFSRLEFREEDPMLIEHRQKKDSAGVYRL
jgi:hypothetical protein